MTWKHLAAVTLLAATANFASAQGTFRLLSGDAPATTKALGLATPAQTMTLKLDDTNQADTESVWYRGGWGGGWRGGWGWGGRGWGWGGYYPRAAFYRPYFYPGFAYNFGYYRPYSYYYYAAPPVYYYSAPPVYYYPPVYSYAPAAPVGVNAGPVSVSAGPVGVNVSPAGVSVSINTPRISASFGSVRPERISSPVMPGQSAPPPQAVPGGPAGTYPYDGGPSSPVPMPRTAPEAKPAPTVPLEGRPVSAPAKPSTVVVKYFYPAYGEQPSMAAPVTPQQDRVIVKNAR